MAGKADVGDVNRALLDVCRELEGRATGAQLGALAEAQAALAGGLHQAHTTARCMGCACLIKGRGMEG